MTGILVYALLVLLLTVMIVSLFPVNCSVSQKEGFEATQSIQTSCPRGTKSFLNQDGDLQCCSGNVNGKTCEGRIVCSFSSKSEKIPFCGSLPISSNLFDMIMAIPQRDVPIDDDEASKGPVWFSNVFTMLYLIYLLVLNNDNVPKEEKNKIRSLYEDTKSWKERYAVRADNTALAKEAKYRFVELEKANLSIARQNELNTIYMELKNNVKRILEHMKRSIPILESELKRKNIQI